MHGWTLQVQKVNVLILSCTSWELFALNFAFSLFAGSFHSAYTIQTLLSEPCIPLDYNLICPFCLLPSSLKEKPLVAAAISSHLCTISSSLEQCWAHSSVAYSSSMNICQMSLKLYSQWSAGASWLHSLIYLVLLNHSITYSSWLLSPFSHDIRTRSWFSS